MNFYIKMSCVWDSLVSLIFNADFVFSNGNENHQLCLVNV